MNYTDIIDFWFRELKPEQWFEPNETLDLKMTERFIALHSNAIAGECAYWRNNPVGRLAEIIVIDQFSRNIYRDDPKSFLYDPMALVLSQEAIRGEHHKNLSAEYKRFLYMPFMHSESKEIHNTSVMLFSEAGLENSLQYEREHKTIIDRFGRFPHRNYILKRHPTQEEIEFISENPAIFETASGSWYKEINQPHNYSQH